MLPNSCPRALYGAPFFATLALWIHAVFGTIKPFLCVFAIFVPLVE
jgi:hypothetical protein